MIFFVVFIVVEEGVKLFIMEVGAQLVGYLMYLQNHEAISRRFKEIVVI